MPSSKWPVSRWQASYSDSIVLLFWATAIFKPSLLLQWCCGRLSSSSLHQCPSYWRLWPENRLWNPYIPPPLGDTICTILPADSYWPNLSTSQSSLRRPLPNTLPIVQPAQAAPLAWWTQTCGLCLEARWWMWLGNFSCHSRSTCRCPLGRCRLFVCDGFQERLMPPAVSSVPECLWAVAENLLQGSLLGTQKACWWLCQAPWVQNWWNWKHIIRCLEKKFNVLWFCFP